MPEQPTLLIDETKIRARVEELAEQISRDYADGGELYLVGVLKGAFIFLADLVRRLKIPHHVDFVALASYGDSSQSDGNVRLIMDLRVDIAGKHVLVVDDILDTGATMAYLQKMLDARQPASVKTCVLVEKDKAKRVAFQPDYRGFEIPDVWVVGYGLDFADRFRTLPYIGKIEPHDS